MARPRQRGFVLLLVLLVLMVAGAALFVTARAPGDAERAARDSRSAKVMAGVRDAVIAYAGFGGTNNVKGALPCPDFDDPGDPGSGQSNSLTCTGGSASVYLARLPWRTIDVDTRTGNLWYGIDADYRDEESEVEPLNPSTPASLQVNGEGGYVAVIIHPGDPLAGQTGRPSSTISDYLEEDNADGDQAFTDCTDINNCNDRVAGIRIDALWDPVQRRVLGEVEEVLQDYHAAKGYLPYAADFGTVECVDGNHLGQLPLTDGDGDCGGATEALNESDFPVWIRSEAQGGNDWLDFIVYHVDDDCTASSPGCTTGTLELDGAGGLDTIVAASGRPLGGQARPGSGVADYLDDDENTDADIRYEDGPLAADDNDALRGLELP